MKRKFLAGVSAVAMLAMMTSAGAETLNASAAPQITAAATVQAAKPQTAEPTATPVITAAPEATVEPEVTAEPAATEAPAAQDEGNLRNPTPWIIAAIAGIGAIAAAVFALKKRRAATAAPAAPVEESPAEEDNVIRVRAIGNVHHIGRRKAQQDAFGVSALADTALIERKGILAVVADGMGGLQNSGEISKAMVRGALADFARTPEGQRKMLVSILSEANKKVDEQFSGLGSIGTTFIAASVKDGMLDFISVGDSRIALVRGGSLITLNRAHNFAAELETAAARNDGNITTAESDPRRAALTSYLGMRSLQKVDLPVESIRLMRGDRVILMTDGVFGTVDNETIANALQRDAVSGAEQLEREVLARHTVNQDNFTAIILEV